MVPRTRCLVLVTALVSFATPAVAQETVELRWKLPEKGVLGYAMWQSPQGKAPTLDIDALADGKAPDPAALAPPAKLDAPTIALVVQRHHQRMNVQMVALEDLTPKGMKGKEPLTHLQAGSLQDSCDVELDGRVASFWKPQRTRNIYAMLFELPRGPVKVGDTWSIGVSLLELAIGAVQPSREAHTNRVRLSALKQEGDDLVATLDYVLAESFATDTNPGLPGRAIGAFRMRMAFVARGEFYVKKGAWKQLSGWMSVEGSTDDLTQRAFLGLRPTTPVPAAWTKPLLHLK
jgi:hypothetical protein